MIGAPIVIIGLALVSYEQSKRMRKKTMDHIEDKEHDGTKT
jgi:hypothetical protein